MTIRLSASALAPYDYYLHKFQLISCGSFPHSSAPTFCSPHHHQARLYDSATIISLHSSHGGCFQPLVPCLVAFCTQKQKQKQQCDLRQSIGSVYLETTARSRPTLTRFPVVSGSSLGCGCLIANSLSSYCNCSRQSNHPLPARRQTARSSRPTPASSCQVTAVEPLSVAHLQGTGLHFSSCRRVCCSLVYSCCLANYPPLSLLYSVLYLCLAGPGPLSCLLRLSSPSINLTMFACKSRCLFSCLLTWRLKSGIHLDIPTSRRSRCLVT